MIKQLKKTSSDTPEFKVGNNFNDEQSKKPNTPEEKAKGLFGEEFMINLKNFSSGAINLVFLIILAGGAIAIYNCGKIEYLVLSDLITGVNTILLVIAFEAAKVVTLLISNLFPNSKIFQENERVFIKMRLFMVLISFVMSAIFFGYQLDSPNRDAQLEQMTLSETKRYDSQKEDINADIDVQMERELALVNEEINEMDQRMVNEQRFKTGGADGEYRGARFYEAQGRHEKAIEKRAALIERWEDKRFSRVQELDSNYQSRLLAANKSVDSVLVSGHPKLLGFLNITLLGLGLEVTAGSYVLLAFFISLLISGGMEILVWGTFILLSIFSKYEIEK